jgi:hypothetical protein
VASLSATRLDSGILFQPFDLMIDMLVSLLTILDFTDIEC